MTHNIVRHGDAGPPVLLVMGFGMRGVMWEPIVRHLAVDHRVATYDHPGTAVDDDEPSPRSMLGLCLAAAGVLDALSWERAHVVGVSMGGMVSQELAIRFPERVSSLTLLSTHAGGPGAAIPTWRGILVLGAPRSPRWKLEHLLYPADYRDLHSEILSARTTAQLAQQIPRSTLRAQLQAVARHDTRSRLDRIAAPALVIEAAQDRLVRPGPVRALARNIPGARFVKLPDAGHGLVVQEAERVSSLIREHVARAEAHGAAVQAGAGHARL